MKKDPLGICPADKKSIFKKKKHYFRDGRNYCHKGCWRRVNKVVEEPEATPEGV